MREWVWDIYLITEKLPNKYILYPGVHTIAYAFPNVKIVTSAIDAEINERFHVLPGIGNFGDR